MASKGVDEYFPKFTWHFLIYMSFKIPTPIQLLSHCLVAIRGGSEEVKYKHFPGNETVTLDYCPIVSVCLNGGYKLFFFSLSCFSLLLFFVPTYIFVKQQVKPLLCVHVPTVEKSAKCHLSTCALMINTILMVSINFLLHHQKAAVAQSLSQPCACFGKPLCGSCWMEIVGFSLPHTHNFFQTDVPNMHTHNRTLYYLMQTRTLLHAALLLIFHTLAHR